MFTSLQALGMQSHLRSNKKRAACSIAIRQKHSSSTSPVRANFLPPDEITVSVAIKSLCSYKKVTDFKAIRQNQCVEQSYLRSQGGCFTCYQTSHWLDLWLLNLRSHGCCSKVLLGAIRDRTTAVHWLSNDLTRELPQIFGQFGQGGCFNCYQRWNHCTTHISGHKVVALSTIRDGTTGCISIKDNH